MLADSRYLVLAFQLWALTSTRTSVQADQYLASQLEPAYVLTVTGGGSNSEGNQISFECRTIVDNFDVKNWVLYRNGVPENTTDPCISPGRDSNDVITIMADCNGHFSCGADYTNGKNQTGLVLSQPIAVYGKNLGSCSSFRIFIMEKTKVVVRLVLDASFYIPVL